MKKQISTSRIRLLSLSLLLVAASSAFAQSAAFTYQGRLSDNGVPASGIYDLRFTIYDLDSGGDPVVEPLTNSAVGISNGLFTNKFISVNPPVGNRFYRLFKR